MKYTRLLQASQFTAYHGTQNPDLQLTANWLYLITDFDMAKNYAQGYLFNYDLQEGETPYVYTMSVQIDKPLNLRNPEMWEKYGDYLDDVDLPAILPELKEQGYDGIIYEEDNGANGFIVFNAQKQCKILKKQEVEPYY